MKILLVSHGELSKATKGTIEMILGTQDNLHTLSLNAEEAPQDFYIKFSDKIKQLDDENILVLADLKGGTPCNVATLYKKNKGNINIIAGFNLPLVMSCCLSNGDFNNTIKESQDAIQIVEI